MAFKIFALLIFVFFVGSIFTKLLYKNGAISKDSFIRERRILQLRTSIASALIILFSVLLAYPEILKFMHFEFSSEESKILRPLEGNFYKLFTGGKSLLMNFTLIVLIYLVNLIEKMIHRENYHLSGKIQITTLASFFLCLFLWYTAANTHLFPDYYFGFELIFIIFVISLGIQQYWISVHNRVYDRIEMESVRKSEAV